ncbi:hypothetical protein [Streptomyces hyaluromycini]|uniref:hypothetical protein n=1 Tax=Streptomyces hyaluromycini TaxID=1377993 RepID=UPI00142E73EA|nr:hypothetical protein [Streptomyces hyaluromycini]
MPRAEHEPTTRFALRGRLVALDGLTVGADADATFLSVPDHENDLPAGYPTHLSQLLT